MAHSGREGERPYTGSESMWLILDERERSHTLVLKVCGSFGLGSEISHGSVITRGSETRARGRVAGGYPEGMGEGGRRGAVGAAGVEQRASGVGRGDPAFPWKRRGLSAEEK